MAGSLRKLALAVLVAQAGAAAAAPRRVIVDTPPEAFTTRGATISPFLYLDRCVGGCAVTGSKSVNDASKHTTTIPTLPGSYFVQEFANATGETGAAADADWTAVVQCMQEVYSPYAVTVTDTLPTGVAYNEAIIAGNPTDLGLANDILGIAPLAGNCAPQNNVMSFSFSNHHDINQRAFNICWTAAQESAHAYGLDHEFEFIDGTSACNDPMTYRTDCGGEKFFRNKRAKCGTSVAGKCRCTDTQNSHQSMLAVFGAGTPITAAPHTQVIFPLNFAAIGNGSIIHITGGSPRGVAKMELFLNGSRWAVQAGAPFGQSGQPDNADYPFTLPGGVPDGIIDIQGKAFDDLGAAVLSIPITVMKGAACTTAATCAAHQTCNAGRCVFAAPAGELGDSCDYGQFCKSWECLDTSDGKRCSQECVIGEPSACPSGFMCDDVGGGLGFCVTSDGGGCCSVGHDRGVIWIQAALAALVLGRIGRRRPRRAV